MNHIHRLAAERDAAQAQLAEVEASLTDLMAYLLSAKFAGPDADYVHVRTDVLPKLTAIRAQAVL
jgi:hypothetical protein